MSSIIILSLISSLLYYILLFIEKKIIKNIWKLNLLMLFYI
jgi:hypothetical protein